MENKKPRVSIGLPVYNGEKTLVKSLDAILSQTYKDFELVISDNASTDRTPEICAQYAARDARIRYYRNEQNIGGGNNHNRTFFLSSGEYFHWATDDDYAAPEYIARCVEVLDEDPSVVLCLSAVGQVDEQGRLTGMEDMYEAMFPRPHDRFKAMISMRHECQAIFGLMRSHVMHKTFLWLPHTDADRTFLAEMSLHGKLFQIREMLFFRGRNAENSTNLYPDWRERMEWFNPEYREHLSCPHLTQFWGLLQIIWRSPLTVAEKLHCYKHMAFWLGPERHGRFIIKDLVLAVVWIVRYPVRRRRQTIHKNQL